MQKWYSRFNRGDVWFLHLPTEKGDGSEKSSVQKKSRPYLIVSCEENNLNAPTFNVVPITSRDNDGLPMHVNFRFGDGTVDARNQMVLCEQITTVDIMTFNNSRSYFMYRVSIEIMNRVDEALTRQLGLKPRVADMKVLERIVTELAEKQYAEIVAAKEREASMRMEKLAEYLAKKFNLNLDTAALLNDTEYRDEELRQVDKSVVKEMRDAAKERKVKSTSEAKARNTTWTETQKRGFLVEYESLPLDKVMSKYNMTKSTVQSTAYRFRKEFGIKVRGSYANKKN